MRETQTLLQIGSYLRSMNYAFITITPESHARVLARSEPEWSKLDEVDILRELFGWNRAVPEKYLPQDISAIDESAVCLTHVNGFVRANFRYSTLGSLLLVHSNFPTENPDAIFFGPDSYRFARWMMQSLQGRSGFKRVIDLGCGTGVGGLVVSRILDDDTDFVLSDSNELALEFARLNVELNRNEVDAERFQFRKSNFFDEIEPGGDLVIANPPFIVDPKERAYRNGGNHYGCEISARMTEAALRYLPSGGKLLMYTGSSIVRGQDIFKSLVDPSIRPHQYTYSELDPDLFGEELSQEFYRDVDRIAAVGLELKRV